MFRYFLMLRYFDYANNLSEVMPGEFLELLDPICAIN